MLLRHIWHWLGQWWNLASLRQIYHPRIRFSKLVYLAKLFNSDKTSFIFTFLMKLFFLPFLTKLFFVYVFDETIFCLHFSPNFLLFGELHLANFIWRTSFGKTSFGCTLATPVILIFFQTAGQTDIDIHVCEFFDL